MKIVHDEKNIHKNIIHPNKRKIIFSHRRAFGDTIMFSSGIRDFKLLFPDFAVGVDSNHSFIFENNPYVAALDSNDPGVEFYRVGYPAVGSCNNTNVHFTQMFLLDMIAVADLHYPLPLKLGEFCASFANGEVGDPCLGNPAKCPEAKEPFISLKNKYQKFCNDFARQRGDIHLSDKEKSYNLIKDIYKIDHYWVIAPGGKRDCTTKIWDWRKFQDVINYFKGRITFVVVGKGDLLVERLDGVIDLVDKFNDEPRGLFSLVYHAEGCVSGPSALMHLAAAMTPKFGKARKPCVSIFGGREPIGWSWYTNHQILHTNGAFICCSDGGCWTARTYPLPKDPKHNDNLCKNTLEDDGRTVQACMASITSNDVIRAIEKYYDGNIYQYERNEMIMSNTEVMQKLSPLPNKSIIMAETNGKKINLLGNLHTQGGGEQSLIMITKVLVEAGFDVRLFSFQGVHDTFKNLPIITKTIQSYDFLNMYEGMEKGLPLLFYANDSTRKFAEGAEKIVNNSSSLIIGINYVNTPLPKCDWLAKSLKLNAVIFQNEEKKEEWERDQVGFDSVKLIVNPGAIELDKFLEVCTSQREEKQPFIILKHCVADYRKYITKESEGKGEKLHIWQKHLSKDNDVKFYTRLLKDTKDTNFYFMKAHEQIESAFVNEKRMRFFKWNEIPVTEFLSLGHAYLYRTSNLWRDQYPRVVGEALAAGLPVLTEPRDGTKDRVIHGDTGFYCVDYDEYVYAIKILQRKEKYRQAMGRYAKDWAKKTLDPKNWVKIITNSMFYERIENNDDRNWR